MTMILMVAAFADVFNNTKGSNEMKDPSNEQVINHFEELSKDFYKLAEDNSLYQKLNAEGNKETYTLDEVWTIASSASTSGKASGFKEAAEFLKLDKNINHGGTVRWANYTIYNGHVLIMSRRDQHLAYVCGISLSTVHKDGENIGVGGCIIMDQHDYRAAGGRSPNGPEPFDIMILRPGPEAIEKKIITGIQVLNEGHGTSIDDTNNEIHLTYVAKQVSEWKIYQ